VFIVTDPFKLLIFAENSDSEAAEEEKTSNNLYVLFSISLRRINAPTEPKYLII
jgi:hypothetical protein